MRRRCRDIKSQKACEQVWEANIHCKNELVILTIIWLQEFQCSIYNMFLRYKLLL